MLKKRWMMASALAMAISLGAAMPPARADSERPIPASAESKESDAPDAFLAALGAASEEEVRDALYEGTSLSRFAAERGQDVQAVIDLQIAQLTEQLDARLAAGSIDSNAYAAMLAEIPDLVASSAYREGLADELESIETSAVTRYDKGKESKRQYG